MLRLFRRYLMGDGSSVFPVLRALLVLIPSLAACQGNDTARWVDAPVASGLERRDTLQENLESNEYAEGDLACKNQIESARAELAQPGSALLRRAIQACARQGLGFGDELRCHEDRLQVKCT